ncbi:unnamed protein product [Nezara viridula]|uniref:Uncharacterized protein n=1 Tax=Nezara viridula TaxID=85310 RepID=A0A9P0E318_NEZVI|nr:unnamed protein product [Nezara viridula]
MIKSNPCLTSKKTMLGQTFINQFPSILTTDVVLISIILIQLLVIVWIRSFKKSENKHKNEYIKTKEDLRFNRAKGNNENMIFLEEIYLELQALKRLHNNIFRSILRMDLKIKKLIQLKHRQHSRRNKYKEKLKSHNLIKPEETFQVKDMTHIFNELQDIDELLNQTREKTAINRKNM